MADDWGGIFVGVICFCGAAIGDVAVVGGGCAGISSQRRKNALQCEAFRGTISIFYDSRYKPMTDQLSRILPTVQKPARYTGGEYNEIKKNILVIV